MSNLMYGLFELLKEHNRGSARSGKAASFQTQEKRRFVLAKSFEELQELGYHPHQVDNFKPKHVQALVELWMEKEQSRITIQNKLSVLRVFSGWIKKQGMVKDVDQYVPADYQGKHVSRKGESKAWTDNGVDPKAKIAQVCAMDPVVGVMLKLQLVFGIRARESWRMRPILADREMYLDVNLGTKGGRHRTGAIDNELKRLVLDEAQRLTPKDSMSMIPPQYDLKAWSSHYYYVLDKCGISRKNGITGHGLRHQYANDLFKELLGYDSPVRGGPTENLDQDAEVAARMIISENLGHAREDIPAMYTGGRSNPSRKKVPIDKRNY